MYLEVRAISRNGVTLVTVGKPWTGYVGHSFYTIESVWLAARERDRQCSALDKSARTSKLDRRQHSARRLWRFGSAGSAVGTSKESRSGSSGEIAPVTIPIGSEGSPFVSATF